eukprot:7615539-Alexandrium_andersonii.AAC.1
MARPSSGARSRLGPMGATSVPPTSSCSRRGGLLPQSPPAEPAPAPAALRPRRMRPRPRSP